jgi:dipeptidyl aminopeptidase/acylaminoacyl peptidase
MGEGHVPSHYREPNRRDVLARVLAWLAQHLGDA